MGEHLASSHFPSVFGPERHQCPEVWKIRLVRSTFYSRQTRQALAQWQDVASKTQLRGPSNPTRGDGLLTKKFSLGVQEAEEGHRQSQEPLRGS